VAQPAPRIVVVGSVNLDLVARVHRLPGPGETLAAHELRRVPGGKGANQALAARRLGTEVALVGAVGVDAAAAEALALLRADGVDLTAVTQHPRLPTGHALVTVDDEGETTIVVAAGANDAVVFDAVMFDGWAQADAVLTVLEVPDAAVASAAAHATGLFVLNAAPARPVAPDVLARADLVVVNRAEYAELEGLDAAGAVAVTLGGDGAELRRGGHIVARAAPPPTTVVDGTGAGDCFTAALTVALLTGRSDTEALRYACAAGALAVSRPGAQPALPWAAELV
jgi:ribokinase